MDIYRNGVNMAESCSASFSLHYILPPPPPLPCLDNGVYIPVVTQTAEEALQPADPSPGLFFFPWCDSNRRENSSFLSRIHGHPYNFIFAPATFPRNPGYGQLVQNGDYCVTSAGLRQIHTVYIGALTLVFTCLLGGRRRGGGGAPPPPPPPKKKKTLI